MGRPKANKPRNSNINVRLTAEERATFDDVAADLGFANVSEYIRFLHNQRVGETVQATAAEDFKARYPKRLIRSFHKTRLGEMIWGDSRAYLFNGAKPDSVDLIMTSPPFGLVRKKSYGNEDADEYCNWFRPFAEGFKRALKDDGSLVIDIGGAWIPGQPTRSLYHFKLLVMLVEEYGFHLCQEHYWWNPAKLPTPAEWVNVRRVRVKDAVNTVWWLSKTPFPKANNRRVLAPYSKSMQDLLRNGYVAKLRPSGHDISSKFQKDNGGSVPPNLLAIANTESTSRYQEYCRDNNIPIHPARFPPQLPEYFIRFLTEPGDVVLDPFGGSCVTGAVAEVLGRRWVCCEMSEEYLDGALARFQPSPVPLLKDRPASYEIAPPCAVPVDDADTPLFADGGAKRPPRVTEEQAEPKPKRRARAAV
ncbi:DNA-methyltransferase [Salipiger marinus]|uniref:Methyltransferase n=1 Tax=Salipiger marinus TaxID=555512 RepID=A0A1G8U884_9RHOB|nr:site-specific DNA-methyltransferase [Salipiger marinus]SDJ50026.1 site-specific DNA-methyltransferase (cytosine-N4-specific) [Salipiger marinus]